jgi:hypothetical protein
MMQVSLCCQFHRVVVEMVMSGEEGYRAVVPCRWIVLGGGGRGPRQGMVWGRGARR